jgi:hypothetical protein
MMNTGFYLALTLQADNQAKRGQEVAYLGDREHARRAFTALEKLSFISDSTDSQLNRTTTAVECLQEVVVQRAPYHFCGALEMNVPNTVGFVAFVVIIFFGALCPSRRARRRTLLRIRQDDHTRNGRYKVKGTRRLVYVYSPLAGTAPKPLVDGEFWDASERRVRWSVYEMEKTSPGGKATPGILRKTTYTQRNYIALHDHVRKGQYRQNWNMTLRPVHVDVARTAAKPLVEGEFWDASERRVNWSVYELERTSPGERSLREY